MVRHQLVRVHDAAGKRVIDNRKIRLDLFTPFRGMLYALELDRPLLEVQVCMDCAFGSFLPALLPCLHCQLLPLRQLQLLIKRLQRTKTRSSVG
jgi:hypothetical protein